jgi:hypothetical protein
MDRRTGERPEESDAAEAEGTQSSEKGYVRTNGAESRGLKIHQGRKEDQSHGDCDDQDDDLRAFHQQASPHQYRTTMFLITTRLALSRTKYTVSFDTKGKPFCHRSVRETAKSVGPL